MYEVVLALRTCGLCSARSYAPFVGPVHVTAVCSRHTLLLFVSVPQVVDCLDTAQVK